MATIRQRKLAKVLIENSQLDNPLNAGQLLAKVGYSRNLVKQPGRVIESEGVKEALNDYGFSVEKAKEVVGSILTNEKNKAQDRLKASEQVFKVHGAYAPEKHLNVNIEASVTDEDKELATRLMQLERDNG